MDAFDILLVVGSSKSMPSWNNQLQNYASNVIHFSGKTLLADFLWEKNTVPAEKTSRIRRIISQMNRAFKNEEVTCLKKEWKGSIYNLVIT
jgi:hypothetical protein